MVIMGKNSVIRGYLTCSAYVSTEIIDVVEIVCVKAIVNKRSNTEVIHSNINQWNNRVNIVRCKRREYNNSWNAQ